MKYIFILNEIAGKGKCKKILPNIENACKKRNIDFEIRYITAEKSGYDIALEYKDKKYVIYVVGGDGTLAFTLPAIIGTKKSPDFSSGDLKDQKIRYATTTRRPFSRVYSQVDRVISLSPNLGVSPVS